MLAKLINQNHLHKLSTAFTLGLAWSKNINKIAFVVTKKLTGYVKKKVASDDATFEKLKLEMQVSAHSKARACIHSELF